ncbi:MAG: class II aldolase/adducin family protein [Alphaproteobacteria bacterium]|nr:class II aldolase/adducin family protein [Alphaproteobacteria bacterium]
MARQAAAPQRNLSEAEQQTRVDLAACYRDFARRELDDSIYTHLSARIPDSDAFLFIGFGLLFADITASRLMKVDLAGANIGGTADRVNPAGWVVHQAVYEAVPEAQSVMHLHTIAGVAVSAQTHGLLPINQFAITHAGQIAYHDYDGPGLRPAERKRFVADLGVRRIMFLRNHGTLVHGRTIAEAYTLMHYLERTCATQVAALAGGSKVVTPRKSVVARTVRTAQGTGDRAFGEVGFRAMMRRLDRIDPSYRD